MVHFLNTFCEIYKLYSGSIGMLDIIDMDGILQGDEEHVSGWDLVYDNGFIEIDPAQCNYTTFLGAAVPEPEKLLNNIAQTLQNNIGNTDNASQSRRPSSGNSSQRPSSGYRPSSAKAL